MLRTVNYTQNWLRAKYGCGLHHFYPYLTVQSTVNYRVPGNIKEHLDGCLVSTDAQFQWDVGRNIFTT